MLTLHFQGCFIVYKENTSTTSAPKPRRSLTFERMWVEACTFSNGWWILHHSVEVSLVFGQPGNVCRGRWKNQVNIMSFTKPYLTKPTFRGEPPKHFTQRCNYSSLWHERRWKVLGLFQKSWSSVNIWDEEVGGQCGGSDKTCLMYNILLIGFARLM